MTYHHVYTNIEQFHLETLQALLHVVLFVAVTAEFYTIAVQFATSAMHREMLVLPHHGLVSVELLAGSTHNAVLFASDVAAVRRFDSHLGMCTELEDEWTWSSLVRVDTAVTLH